jgi:hypothetical protein
MQTIQQTTKNLSRLESDSTPRSSMCKILAISPDSIRAIVVPMADGEIDAKPITVNILRTPGISIPYDTVSCIGLLHGDPKAPYGVEIFIRTTPHPDLSHNITNSLYGSPGESKETDVIGRFDVETDNTEAQINMKRYPQAHAMVLKPPKIIPADYIGNNDFINDDQRALIDDQGAYVSISEDESRLIADNENGILINAKSGVSIEGKLNIGASFEDIRINGAWKLNPMMKFMIPSTAVSPIPTVIWDPPGTSLVNGLSSIMNDIKNT